MGSIGIGTGLRKLLDRLKKPRTSQPLAPLSRPPATLNKADTLLARVGGQRVAFGLRWQPFNPNQPADQQLKKHKAEGAKSCAHTFGS